MGLGIRDPTLRDELILIRIRVERNCAFSLYIWLWPHPSTRLPVLIIHEIYNVDWAFLGHYNCLLYLLYCQYFKEYIFGTLFTSRVKSPLDGDHINRNFPRTCTYIYQWYMCKQRQTCNISILLLSHVTEPCHMFCTILQVSARWANGERTLNTRKVNSVGR